MANFGRLFGWTEGNCGSDGSAPRVRGSANFGQSSQEMLSTRSASIPLLGDTELNVWLPAAGMADSGRARVYAGQTSAIISLSVRELAGGREEFETQRRDYGF